jgi:nucleoid DNA-binding protein
MLSNYLKALIESNNRIIIPDFGAFMIQDSPEGKQISFNDFLKFNDGLLVNQIIKTDKVSKIQATDQIKEFITEVEKSFAQNKPY